MSDDSTRRKFLRHRAALAWLLATAVAPPTAAGRDCDDMLVIDTLCFGKDRGLTGCDFSAIQ